MNLYTLPYEFQQALDAYYACFDLDTGEQLETDEIVAERQTALDDLVYRANETLEHLCAEIANRKASEDAYQAERDRLDRKAKSEARNIERLKVLVDTAFSKLYQGKPVHFGNFTLSYRKSEGVRIDDEHRIPDDYRRVKTEIDKASIKDALKRGDDIPGASLETRRNLSIR